MAWTVVPILICASPLVAQDITFDEVADNLTEQSTRVQRDAFWERNEGSIAAVVGRIVDVRPAGWILPMTIEMTTARADITVSCQLLPRMEEQAIELGIGEPVTCRGNLFTYMLVFDTLSVTIDNASFE